ncbi:uncharacterized protein N7479_010029 [Penicillium vulpinum]|uniref:Uncharacterized protein n=1 Tax=Penicillium vulpinum TaxID=29845 RepID=A0A1V6RDY5_9EURO|nr:uncharacterized protein N7479_010029 [Penicillium vulpinum]KAJ5951616.1 hypothetical protein N7479_010029 [Penicillium vulpinum]OQE00007.1 hypothetical protein PENVUL_c060G03866 [Penicillium vulpinum]
MSSAIPSTRQVSVNSPASAPIAAPAGAEKSNCPGAKISENSGTSSPIPAGEDQSHLPANVPTSTISAPIQSEIHFVNLPVEIHEIILDQLFGERASAGNHTAYGAQHWTKALHHPRRKALSNLALICRVWTGLVQSRIYRHIRIKGSREGVADCVRWFKRKAHLIPYVCHIEVWMPIWGDRAVWPNISGSNTAHYAAQTAAGHVIPMQWNQHNNQVEGIFYYRRALNNASLEDIFKLVRLYFPAARVLTLEGGHCKNSPRIRHFCHDNILQRRLPVLGNIQTLIMRGSWNLMRKLDDWDNIARALPALSEWHCSWAQPHLNAYFIMIHILTYPPIKLRHINISLEGLYNHNDDVLAGLFGHRKSLPPICSLLGEMAPRLESFTYTGRVCWYFFETLKQSATAMSSRSRLRSMDIVVKACCHKQQVDGSHHWSQLSQGIGGITSMEFILAFEAMVIKAIECLSVLPTLEYLRIRFIDLDSSCPPLNPYFQLFKNECTGLWSDDILEALRMNRPSAAFFSLTDGIYAEYDDQQIVGALMPRVRPLGIQVSMYSLIADSSNPY